MNVPSIDNLFHRLWTKAKDAPGYNKKEWQVLGSFVTFNRGHETYLGEHNHVGLQFEEKYPQEAES